MSTGFYQSAVSSMSSVLSSIENDRQVYRWFLMLISLPDIRQTLCSQAKTKEDYRTLKNIQTTEIITYILLALIMTASCFTGQHWGLCLGILPLIILVSLFKKNRRITVNSNRISLYDSIFPKIKESLL